MVGLIEHGRVGGLEPSRTIGDFDVKASQPPGVLSVVPHVSVLNKIEKPSLLFIGTDGVWDSLNGEAVIKLLKRNKRLWCASFLALSSLLHR